MNYYMFNKPYGCVTARRDARFPVVMDYFRELHNESLSPVGRLDRETEGLLLITDDGKWNQLLTRPSNLIEKIYEFAAMGRLDSAKITHLETGILLTGSPIPTAPAKINVTGSSFLFQVLPRLPEEVQKKSAHNRPDHPVVYGRITITEGRKRQIRRMMKAVGCCVIHLKRISMGNILLDETLKAGEWKELDGFLKPAPGKARFSL